MTDFTSPETPIGDIAVTSYVVGLAYIFILGRRVESAKAIRHHMADGDLATLRRALLTSEEFRNIYLNDFIKES